MRERRAESIVGSPNPFETTPLAPGTSPGFGQYGSLISESPKA